MVLDVVNGQEHLDPVTQSCGNPVEADIIACLVQFINEQAKVPFNRMETIFNEILYLLFYFVLEIGIITPYNYQVKLIEQKLIQRNLHQHKIEIGTGLFI